MMETSPVVEMLEKRKKDSLVGVGEMLPEMEVSMGDA